MLLRFGGDARLGQRDAHIHPRDAAEELVEVLEPGRTARQDDAAGQAVGITRVLDFLGNELSNIGSARLDDRSQVAQQNILRVAGRAAVHADELVFGRQFGHRRAVAQLEALDQPLGDTHRPDVAVDGRSTHRDAGDVAHHVVVVDRHVGHAAAHVDHRHALLLLLGGEHRFGGDQRIGEDTRHADAQTLERHVEPLHGGLQAEDEVERRRELASERPHGVLHLLVVVDHVVLGHTLHDGLVVGRLDVAHAVEERLDVALADAVLGVEDKDVVRMARTAHEVAREARIGFADAEPQARLDLRDRLADGIAHQFDILDFTGPDPFDGFRHDALHVERAFGIAAADGDHDVRRTQIDSDRITLPFHVYLSKYSYLPHVRSASPAATSGRPRDPCTGHSPLRTRPSRAGPVRGGRNPQAGRTSRRPARCARRESESGRCAG